MPLSPNTSDPGRDLAEGERAIAILAARVDRSEPGRALFRAGHAPKDDEKARVAARRDALAAGLAQTAGARLVREALEQLEAVRIAQEGKDQALVVKGWVGICADLPAGPFGAAMAAILAGTVADIPPRWMPTPDQVAAAVRAEAERWRETVRHLDWLLRLGEEPKALPAPRLSAEEKAVLDAKVTAIRERGRAAHRGGAKPEP